MATETIITVVSIVGFLLIMCAFTFVKREGPKHTPPIYELPTDTRPRRGQWSFSKAFLRSHPFLRNRED